YARNDLSLIAPPLSDLGSDTITDSAAVSLQQTLYRSPRDEFNLTVSLSRRDNHTTLLGHNFSFSDGAIDGWMNSTAIRTSLDWTTRTDTWVIAARSTLSAGIDALGATIHQDSQPDSRFFTWLGEVQHVWRITPIDSTLLSRASVQIADRHLLALEQFSLGGVDTVRGYRESTLLRDDAVFASVELRKPLPLSIRGVDLQGALFSDFGYGWDRSGGSRDRALLSVGCGVLFDILSHVQGQVYWGIPLCNQPKGDNLQDMGIHFQMVLTAF
ncbi:MAG TPA: ShlB/FhaC/HecB family hemolysin secretion/activation protein, partial [Phycisphaerae bacterium]|nr:ShlB/FhaC/HecB family hemolysin secretion/activation protein [Phycisphaerae bacterium]